MSIAFKCPTCQAVLSLQDECAGLKTACPSCGQKLLVPVPPTRVLPAAHNKTVLGQLEPTEESQTAPGGGDSWDTAPADPPQHRRWADQWRPALLLTVSGAWGTFGIIVFWVIIHTGVHPGQMVPRGLVIVGLLAFAIGLVAAIAAHCGWQRHCPTCSAWFARHWVRDKISGQRRKYGLVTRKGQSSQSFFVDGLAHFVQSWGESTRQERVPVIETAIERRYSCRCCGARWHDDVTVEREDFERG